MEYQNCIDSLKMKNNILLNLWLHFKHKQQCNKFNFQVIAWKELESSFKLSCHLDYAEIVPNHCSDSSDQEGRTSVCEKLFYGLE